MKIEDLKIRVIGLGHPTQWHCSINQTFKTEEEAIIMKETLEKALELYFK